jgi:hypothetical protein
MWCMAMNQVPKEFTETARVILKRIPVDDL